MATPLYVKNVMKEAFYLWQQIHPRSYIIVSMEYVLGRLMIL